MRKDARRATKVVARTTKPRSATTQTPHFAATLRDGGFPGGLLCRSACQGDWPLAAPRFAHSIPECRRRNRAGLDQRFHKCGSGSMSALFNDVTCGSLRPFPLHAARVRVRGARAHGFVVRRLFGLHQTALLTPRPAPGLHTVAHVCDLIRGSHTRKTDYSP